MNVLYNATNAAKTSRLVQHKGRGDALVLSSVEIWFSHYSQSKMKASVHSFCSALVNMRQKVSSYFSVPQLTAHPKFVA
jgi:hypothetical protein